MMHWRQKQKKLKGDVVNRCSLSKTLKKEGKISEDFEIMLGGLSLDELIALKLELAAKSFNGKLYGFPLWHSLSHIVKDAVLKYVFTMSKTHKEAQYFLGLSYYQYKKALWKHGTELYFDHGFNKRRTNYLCKEPKNAEEYKMKRRVKL